MRRPSLQSLKLATSVITVMPLVAVQAVAISMYEGVQNVAREQYQAINDMMNEFSRGF